MNQLTKQTKMRVKDIIKEEKELQKEFDLWERVSDETLAKSGL